MMRIFIRLLGYFSLICGLNMLAGRLNDRLWKAQLAINEHPVIPIVAGVIAGRRGSSFGWLGAALSAIPLLQWLHARRDMDRVMAEGFGADYESHIPADAKLAPMRLLNYPLFLSEAAVQYDVTFHETPQRPLKMDVYRPQTSQNGPYPAIIAIHGGGWHNGDKGNWFAPHHRYLTTQGYVVFDVQYRFTEGDEVYWPDQLDDIRAAIRYIKAHATDYDINPERIALVGRSAGAQLALQAAYRAQDDHADTTVTAVVGVYTPGNLFLTAQSHDFRVVKLLGGTSYEYPDRYHDASPISHVDEHSPPTLLLHGYKDILVTPIHSEMLLNRLRTYKRPVAFLRVPWARHGFDAIPFGMGSFLVQYYVDRFLALTLKGEPAHDE